LEKVTENKMKYLNKEDWINDTDLKFFRTKAAIKEKECKCGTDKYFVELEDHESCIIGRIDTVVCTKCKEVQSFRIIR
jgi:hypothetical protein